MEAIKKGKEGVLIDIVVSPNSKKERIKGYDPWRKRIIVEMKEKPEKFKVNKELISFVSSIFHIPKNSVRIVAGEKNPLKTIFVEGVDVKTAESVTERYTGKI